MKYLALMKWMKANLKLARVMLRRNIDTKANGAIGTVQAISARCISVKFDHISDPLDIEKVKGKFMVSKVFADGMAYVALSRVNSLAGLHLTSFENKVNTKCLKEVNRLRKLYSKDLYRKDPPVLPLICLCLSL